MSKYPSTNITLASLEDKGLTVKVKDSEGRPWTVWKKDYDNKDQDSEAWATLQNIKIGESFGVTYGEKEDSFKGQDGKMVNYTKRTIFSIIPKVANPTQPSKINPLYNKQPSASAETKDDTFWDKKAYKQCLWNFWLEAQARGNALPTNWKDLVWNEFNEIERDAKKKFFEFSQPAASARAQDLLVVDSETPAQSDLGGAVLSPPPVGYQGVVPQDIGEAMAGVGTCSICGSSGVMANDGHDCIPF